MVPFLALSHRRSPKRGAAADLSREATSFTFRRAVVFRFLWSNRAECLV